MNATQFSLCSKLKFYQKNTKDKRTRRTKKTSIYKKKRQNCSKNTKPKQRDLVYVQNWNSTKKNQNIKELDIPKKRPYIYIKKKRQNH